MFKRAILFLGVMKEGHLVNLAQDYHSYSCKEQAMGLLRVGTLSLAIVGFGAAVKYFNSGKEKEAIAYASSTIGSAALGAYAGKKGREFAKKVENICVELRNLEYKLLEKRDPLSLPIQTKEDIELKKHRAVRHSFQ